MALRPPVADVKPTYRMLKIVRVGNAKYIAIGRLLPFLQGGEIVQAELVMDGRNFKVTITQTAYVQPKKKSRRKVEN